MPEPKINHRFITCFQSSGRIGKSTMLEGILAWASFAEVPAAIVDCDGEHLTLSKRFPEAAFVNATRSKDEFLQLMASMPDSPISVADFPAQATEFLLDSMQSLRVLDALEKSETRMTVLMFAADDPTATASMAKTYRTLGTRVDYIIVKNPARFRSRLFDESSLSELFRQNKVPVIELPAVTATTLQQINAASAERKRYLTDSAFTTSGDHHGRNRTDNLPVGTHKIGSGFKSMMSRPPRAGKMDAYLTTRLTVTSGAALKSSFPA
jgi:hypothetical protein